MLYIWHVAEILTSIYPTNYKEYLTLESSRMYLFFFLSIFVPIALTSNFLGGMRKPSILYYK